MDQWHKEVCERMKSLEKRVDYLQESLKIEKQINNLHEYSYLMKSNKVEELLGVSRQTLYRMRKSGKLNAYKTGDSNNSHLRYKKTEVGEYLEKNQTEMKDWYEENRNDTD